MQYVNAGRHEAHTAESPEHQGLSTSGTPRLCSTRVDARSALRKGILADSVSTVPGNLSAQPLRAQGSEGQFHSIAFYGLDFAIPGGPAHV